ncbi:biotin--[acetyl-CoA-carboxylase] ligase [Achromobacter sp. GG226]|uniref:biotin--[acetyl-CoA-carboxylase] ligase n=1 Tax=Verticiella alkaliphila TaxID=2779529 RepID=UPI001C0E66CB|nr:biotin--[acetyl-CoA-carboxylase] ligase [Verticiella sp. GG226]MBU4610722.1 biotin--[acetyl-CoA-carboxylase] ligase [Verticiella sp. GG226]
MPVPAPSDLPLPDVLAHRLRQLLPDWAHVAWLPVSGSTNTDLLAQARAGEPMPRLLGTHAQTAGRGRANRNFRTDPGDALMFSCAFETALPMAALPTLSVRLGLAACEALDSLLAPGHRLYLKWPNDLQWGEAKLAGILMESAGSATPGRTRLVIGLGMNLRGADALSDALGRAVADWRMADCAHPPDLVCATIAGRWALALREAESNWQPGYGLSDLPAAFARHDALAGRAVNVLDNGVVQRQGVACGVAPDGQLRLRGEHGEFHVNVGDISVRADTVATP